MKQERIEGIPIEDFIASRETTRQRKQPKTVVERFWSNVNIGSEQECWLWNKSMAARGYGSFAFSQDRNIQASRFSLALKTGVWPDKDVYALHSCDNKMCCNPNHLRWGTNSENIKEAYERNADYAKRARENMRTNCRYGKKRKCYG